MIRFLQSYWTFSLSDAFPASFSVPFSTSRKSSGVFLFFLRLFVFSSFLIFFMGFSIFFVEVYFFAPKDGDLMGDLFNVFLRFFYILHFCFVSSSMSCGWCELETQLIRCGEPSIKEEMMMLVTSFRCSSLSIHQVQDGITLYWFTY